MNALRYSIIVVGIIGNIGLHAEAPVTTQNIVDFENRIHASEDDLRNDRLQQIDDFDSRVVALHHDGVALGEKTSNLYPGYKREAVCVVGPVVTLMTCVALRKFLEFNMGRTLAGSSLVGLATSALIQYTM